MANFFGQTFTFSPEKNAASGEETFRIVCQLRAQWQYKFLVVSITIMLPHIHQVRSRLVEKPFNDPDYIFEVKQDGFRSLAYIERKRCTLGISNSQHFQLLRESLGKLRVNNAILDGEIVCIDENGVSRFNELFSQNINPAFYVFDLPWLDGEDLRRLPLMKRKQLLWKLIQKNDRVQLIYAQHIEEQGIGFFELICRNDLQGVVARRKFGTYKNSTNDWLKIKNPTYSRMKERQLLTRTK